METETKEDVKFVFDLLASEDIEKEMKKVEDVVDKMFEIVRKRRKEREKNGFKFSKISTKNSVYESPFIRDELKQTA